MDSVSNKEVNRTGMCEERPLIQRIKVYKLFGRIDCMGEG